MLPQFKRAVERVAPRSAQAMTGLGLLYQMKGLKKDAAGLYEKALELDPSFAEAEYRLGTTHHEQNELGQASRHYERALEIKPDHLPALFSTASLLQTQGRFREAERTYMKILEIKPGEAQALNNLGVVYEDLGETAKALGAYEAASSAAPKDDLIRQNLEQMRAEYPDARPVPFQAPAPAAAPPAPKAAPRPAAPKGPLHEVILKNGHSLTGAIVERTSEGLWIEETPGAKFYVRNDEVRESNPVKN